MSGTVDLLLGVHAHQPVGNFPDVVESAVLRCYRPFFEMLERHESVKFSVHVSGWLLGQLRKRFPDDVKLLGRMVERGQVELFGGGDTEPVLAAIPEHDRRSQLRAMTHHLQDTFGVRPHGAWLTERVWEPTVVPALARSGIRYTVVDDYHFLCAGHEPEDLGGYFATEEDGRRLDLFPISEALRYRIPFAPVADAIAYLESLPEGWAAIYFDDIEKFGVWPDTYEWVYTKGWLAEFLREVSDSRRLRPRTYADYHAEHAQRGIVYLPSTSYAEMNEWTLPPSRARRFEQLTGRAEEEGTLERDKPFLRGGIWQNFFGKYAEANWMHKRVLQASRRLQALKPPRRRPEMTACLHRAQANDAFWHGLFGGLYLPHLRRSIYANLAALEAKLDAAAARPEIEVHDVDLDGEEEIALRNKRVQAVVRPSAGASVTELMDYRLLHNFADTLARRDQAYYDRPHRRSRRAPATRSRGIASIHQRVTFKSDFDPADLVPDRYARSVFLDRWHPLQAERAEVITYDVQAELMRSSARCRTSGPAFTLTKVIGLQAAGVLAEYEFEGLADAAGRFSVEINLAMPSGGGRGGAYLRNATEAGSFATTHAWGSIADLTLRDDQLKGSVQIEMSPACDLHAAPFYTISQSESGFERIMQAVTLTLSWPLALTAGDIVHLQAGLTIKAIA